MYFYLFMNKDFIVIIIIIIIIIIIVVTIIIVTTITFLFQCAVSTLEQKKRRQ